MNIFINKLLLDPKGEYSLNFNNGNTLELDIEEKWGISGFDLVVGNPPYEDIDDNGISKGGGNNNYTKFIYYSDSIIKKNGFLLFINPPTYFGPGRSNNKNGESLRKDVINKYFHHYINLEECSKYFKVGSKFMYYLIQKINKPNNKLKILCKYNKKIYDTVIDQSVLNNMEYLPFLLVENCIRINRKIEKTENKLDIFHSPDNRSDKKHILKKKKKESFDEYKKRSLENDYIYPMQATGTQVVFSSKICKNQKDKKILMSRSGYLKPFYDNGILGVGGDCYSILVKDEIEAKYIISLLNSKLYEFYISVNKWSGFHNKEVLRNLSYVKLENFNDYEIYNYFKLNNEEIKLIEETVK